MSGVPLVVGVGNPLRGDDGAGPAAAERAARDPRLAGARFRTVVQLTPELAADVAGASVVVIVDARAGAPAGTVDCSPVDPPPEAVPGRGGTRASLSHHLDPAALAGLAGLAYSRIPPVFIVGIGAGRFDAGAPLSPAVAAALPEAVDVVAALVAALVAADGDGDRSDTVRAVRGSTAPGVS